MAWHHASFNHIGSDLLSENALWPIKSWKSTRLSGKQLLMIFHWCYNNESFNQLVDEQKNAKHSLFQSFFKPKCQKYAVSIFWNVRMCCFSLSFSYKWRDCWLDKRSFLKTSPLGSEKLWWALSFWQFIGRMINQLILEINTERGECSHFMFLKKSPSASVVEEKAATLFFWEAPEMFWGLPDFPSAWRWVDNDWILFWVNFDQ